MKPTDALTYLDQTCAYAIQTLPPFAQEAARQAVLRALSVIGPIVQAAEAPKPSTSTPESKG